MDVHGPSGPGNASDLTSYIHNDYFAESSAAPTDNISDGSVFADDSTCSDDHDEKDSLMRPAASEPLECEECSVTSAFDGVGPRSHSIKRKRGWGEPPLPEPEDYSIGINECNNTITDDDTGASVLCRMETNGSSQLCHACKEDMKRSFYFFN